MLLSDIIEQLLLEEIARSGGTLELRRGELATRVGCAPSQINYVIASRFTPAAGFLVESRRGGGGYVRITRVPLEGQPALSSVLSSLGEQISREDAASLLRTLEKGGLLTAREGELLRAAVSDAALSAAPPETRCALRADLLRRFVLVLSRRAGEG